MLLIGCKKDLSPFIENNSDLLFSSLVSQQTSLLAFISTESNPRARESAYHLMIHSLSKKPQLVSQYIQTLSKVEVTPSHAIIVGLLSNYCMKSADLLKEHKPKFVDWFMRIILTSGTKPSQQSLLVFRPLIKILSVEDLAGVFPTLSKVLKRGPESIMVALASVITDISVDLSKFAHSEVFVPLLPYARSSSESTREESVLVFRSLMSKINDAAVVEQIFKDLLSALKGKPPNVYERVGLIQSISSISNCQPAVLSKNLNNVVAGLLDYLEIEANDEAKSVAFVVVGTFLAHSDSVHAKAQKLYQTGLQSDKESLRISVIESLVNMLAKPTSEKINTVKSYLPQLYKVVQATKLSTDAVYASRLLFQLGGVDASIEQKLSADKIWITLLKPDYQLFKETFLSKLKEKDLCSVVYMLESLLTYHHSKLKEGTAEYQ